jgi:hypothetical protein
MYEFSNDDSKWTLLKKLLLNQTSIATVLSAEIKAVYDRLWQINQTISPSSSFNSLDDVVVTVAGTAVQLPDHPTPTGVELTARIGNTGSCYVGGPGVTNSGGSQRGVELVQAGMTRIFRVTNTNLLWVNSDNANDAVGVIIL